MAVTRDLITKYHYFHTSFQIWPDQIKARARGSENCTLSRVSHSGRREWRRKLALPRCPRGRCGGTAARDTAEERELPAVQCFWTGRLGAVGGSPGQDQDPPPGRDQVSGPCRWKFLQTFPSPVALSNGCLQVIPCTNIC